MVTQSWGKKILSFFFVNFFLLIFFFFGGGVVRLERAFHHVEDYGRCRMERSWLWDFPSYREECRVRDLVIRLFVESTGLLNNSMIYPKVCNLFITSFLLWVTYLYCWFLAETLKYLYISCLMMPIRSNRKNGYLIRNLKLVLFSNMVSNVDYFW